MAWQERKGLAIVIAAFVLPLLPFALFAYGTYFSTIQQIDARALRQARAMAAEFSAELRLGEALLRFIEHEVADWDRARFASQGHNFLSTALVDSRNVIGSVSVLDQAGRTVATSNQRIPLDFSLADQPTFQRPMAQSGPVLGGMFISQFSNTRRFVLSKQFTNRRGFRGAVLIAFRTEYYEARLSQIAFGAAATEIEPDSGNVAVVYNSYGEHVVRFPSLRRPFKLDEDDPMMKAFRERQEGLIRGLGSADGRERHYGFARLEDDYGVVTIGLSHDWVIGEWRSGLVLPGAVTLLCCLLLGGAAIVLTRRVRILAASNRALELRLSHASRDQAGRVAELERSRNAQAAALDLAQRAMDAKDHFMAAASHDLRQPLQAARLFQHVLAGLHLDEKQRDILASAEDALEGAEKLLDSIMELTNLEAGGEGRLHIEDVPLDGIFGRLRAELELQARQKGLRLLVVDSQATIRTDAELLTRMLRNLLVNAIAYTPKGGVVLGCRRAGKGLRIDVIDSGFGIPEEKLQMIFDDFVRLDVGSVAGLGLGLSIVKRGATLLGLHVEVRSAPGRGARFSLHVPPDRIVGFIPV